MSLSIYRFLWDMLVRTQDRYHVIDLLPAYLLLLTLISKLWCRSTATNERNVCRRFVLDGCQPEGFLHWSVFGDRIQCLYRGELYFEKERLATIGQQGFNASR